MPSGSGSGLASAPVLVIFFASSALIPLLRAASQPIDKSGSQFAQLLMDIDEGRKIQSNWIKTMLCHYAKKHISRGKTVIVGKSSEVQSKKLTLKSGMHNELEIPINSTISEGFENPNLVQVRFSKDHKSF